MKVGRIKILKEDDEQKALIPIDEDWPFEDDELIKIIVEKKVVKLVAPEWWEIIDWNTMKEVYDNLDEVLKRKILEHGLIELSQQS